LGENSQCLVVSGLAFVFVTLLWTGEKRRVKARSDEHHDRIKKPIGKKRDNGTCVSLKGIKSDTASKRTPSAFNKRERRDSQSS